MSRKRVHDDEDAELAYLEKMLGLTGEGSEKKKKKLFKSLVGQVGEDVGKLLEFADKVFDEDVELSNSDDGDSEDETMAEVEEVNDGERGKGVDGGSTVEVDEVSTSGSEGENEVDGGTGDKYVPPHLRQSAPRRKAMAVSYVKRLNQLANRISEGTLLIVMKNALEVFTLAQEDGVPLKDLSDHLAESIGASYLPGESSTASFIAAQMSILCGVSALVTSQCLLTFLNKIGRIFQNNFSRIADVNVLTEHQQNQRQSVRMCVTALCFLFDFGVLSESVVRSMAISIVGSKMTEQRADLLLTSLRLVGYRFRTEFPGEFRSVMKAIQEPCNTSQELTGRFQFLLEELENLKNNKKRSHDSEARYRFEATRSWLKTDKLFAQIQWNAVLPDVDWNGFLSGSLSISTHTESKLYVGSVDPLITLAKRNRMTTTLQQNVFVAIMGASSVDDAAQRVLASAAKTVDLSHAVAVLLHCCLSEREYNPYYSKVAACICDLPGTSGRRFLRFLKRGVYAQLEVIGNFATEKKGRFRQFCGDLVSSNVLKPSFINFLSDRPPNDDDDDDETE